MTVAEQPTRHQRAESALTYMDTKSFTDESRIVHGCIIALILCNKQYLQCNSIASRKTVLEVI